MAISSLLYSPTTSISLNLDGLLNNAYRQSGFIDNAGSGFLECMCSFRIRTQGASLSGNPVVNVWAYGVSYTGSYPDTLSGIEGAFTAPTGTLNVKPVQSIVITQPAGLPFACEPFPISPAFNGIIPQRWGLLVQDQTGLSLSGNVGQAVQNGASYYGIQLSTV